VLILAAVKYASKFGPHADAARRRLGQARGMQTNTTLDLAQVAVGAVMHRGVITCSIDTPLREVAETMAAERVHCVVACDGEDALWGVVSDLDLVAVASARDIDVRTAGGMAATPVVLVAPDDTVEHAAQLMTENAISHLVVVEPEGGRPVGVLSTLDVARALAANR
jgi:CBS domain-containing protein